MNSEKVPKHVALIPDGNRRWARKKGLKETAGHMMSGSYENLKELFSAARDLGVRYVSVWGFSTENWKRGKTELDALFEIISKGLGKFIENADEEKVGFRFIGRKDRLPKKLVEKIEELEKRTKDYRKFTAILCLDYGGRDEIVRAVNKILQKADTVKSIDEKQFANYLDTKDIPDPDLIVRTGGEKRLSGFMPFQSDYSEVYFTDTFFPDFGAEELKKAVEWFEKIERRFGK
jgi:undecaprenyl diphosphate synthase